jgi:Cu-processing system permease protein
VGSTWLVASDLLREAIYRRWLIGLMAAITVVVIVLALSMQMTMVDGMFAGTRLFGDALTESLSTIESALRRLYEAVSWTIYACGLLFGIMACSDFAPELLAPGRIEHLLSLPIKRWQLLLGTYLGVMTVAFGAALYGATLLTMLLGMKSGIWSPAAFGAALAAGTAFSAIYGVMLLSAVWVRSAALASALGAALWLAGSVLTERSMISAFEAGWTRETFIWMTAWLPRFSVIGRLSLVVGGYEELTSDHLRAALAAVVLGISCVALAIWQMERQDH